MPRSKPFSGKKKKDQLQLKRSLKAAKAAQSAPTPEGAAPFSESQELKRLKDTKLRSFFFREDPHDVDLRKATADLPFAAASGLQLQTGVADFVHIEIPKRPPWSYEMNRGQLESRETSYFYRWLGETLGDPQLSQELQAITEGRVPEAPVVQETENSSVPTGTTNPPPMAVAEVPRENPARKISLFEANLEVWRQLWRVLERSDVVILLCDVRHAFLHANRGLIDYVRRPRAAGGLGKPLVIVLTKIDLVPPYVVRAWTDSFKTSFPDITIVPFSARAASEAAKAKLKAAAPPASRPEPVFPSVPQGRAKLRRQKQRQKQLKAAAAASLAADEEDPPSADEPDDSPEAQTPENKPPDVVGSLIDSCVRAYQDWYKIRPPQPPQAGEAREDEDASEGDEGESEGSDERDEMSSPRQQQRDPHQSHRSPHAPTPPPDAPTQRVSITIGFVGQPNVGKSSLMNALVGHKVTSVSRTPGHTKHFQTFHITTNESAAPALIGLPVPVDGTPGARDHVIRLVDSPGLVFPLSCQDQRQAAQLRALQVVAGLFPIAQLREPYTSIRYLAESGLIPLSSLLAAYGLADTLLTADRPGATPAVQRRGPTDLSEQTIQILRTADAYQFAIAADQPFLEAQQPAPGSADGQQQPSTAAEAERELRQCLSPGRLCDLLALKRGFFTRGGRPDRHRAALMLLNEVVDGVGSGVALPAEAEQATATQPQQQGGTVAEDPALSAAGQTMGKYRHQLPLWTLPQELATRK
ncbi:putative 50S ribosome-binding GTPase [Paratrimastix pyriformis]|uniref:Guanine nucleotide-binding protein-like 1 n=1 Tax=Paratrimastix pyriformis TaxID=342808 RepID=A0ABQ8UFM5_9EUKA|nr:putative 50S ribosome-binding GTPase [Paratrimastix pyriformis]